MGREWYLNWGTKSSSKKGRTSSSGGGSGRNGGVNNNSREGNKKPTTTPPAATVAAAAAAASAGGCMNAVLHMFDFQLCLHPQDSSFLPDDPTPPKGLEAPRNSLESITEEEKDDHLHISKGIINTKTNRRDTGLKLVQVPRGKIEDLSSESSCSPASARTPTLVARLMGLDILPESNTTTPRSSHSQTSPHIRPSTPPTTSKTKKTSTPKSRTSYIIENISAPPETLRSSASTTRRRSTDVVDHHRLSLQINRENSIQKEMELSRPSCSAISTKRKQGKNHDADQEVSRSPSYYARQIMKQVRETVSRRVGADITNTISAGGRDSSRELRRDEHLLSTSTLKPKKSKKDHSSSPKLKTSCRDDENNNKFIVNQVVLDVPEVPPKKTTTLSLQVKPTLGENESLLTKVAATNISSRTPSLTSNTPKKPLKSYNSIRNKKEEQFVRPSTTTTSSKKCNKKTMLSCDLLHGTTVPSLVPFKKDPPSLPSPTKIHHNYQGITSNAQPSKPTIISNTTTATNTTTRLSRYPRQRIDEKRQEEAKHTPAAADLRYWRNRKDAAATTGTSVMEFQYISRILKCIGIDRDTPVSFMRWFLPSHPLDPSIYHTLEATHYITTTDKYSQQLNLSVNRKLIFHLVDEMLADMLKPYVKIDYHYQHCHPKSRRDKNYQQMNGFQLVKTLCTKIRSFPSSDCRTLQDIDALVEQDLPSIGVPSNMIAYQDEGEEIVTEIERHIMDSLVQELYMLH